MDCLPVKMATIMSWRMFLLSTLVQFGAVGVNLLVLAAVAKVPMSGSPAFRLVRVVVLGMTLPSVVICDMYLVLVKSLMYSSARSWFLLLAPMPKSEPPRNTGADCPAVWLGIGNTPSLSF